ncbi:hypothetical protein GQX74_003262 [Glossina fuscipes]|nr:hypothetical protein GQX74_003262 [Glossina fuscipes]
MYLNRKHIYITLLSSILLIFHKIVTILRTFKKCSPKSNSKTTNEPTIALGQHMARYICKHVTCHVEKTQLHLLHHEHTSLQQENTPTPTPTPTAKNSPFIN